MLTAIVLAAGASRRMGTPKALLATSDGQPFVVRTVQVLQSAELRVVTVVTGDQHDAIAAALDEHLPGVAGVVRNPDPSRGQLSSLIVGLDAVTTRECDAALVTLVDVPMVAVSTVRAVVDAWRLRRASIVRPAIGDRHGHPVIFDARLFDALRRAPLPEGAKRVVRDYAGEIENVPVTDEGCLSDIDTPEDYLKLMQRS